VWSSSLLCSLSNLKMPSIGHHQRKMFAQRLRPAERTSITKKAPVLPSAAAGKKILAGKKRPPSPSLEEKQPKRVSIKGPSRSNSSAASKSVSSKGHPVAIAQLQSLCRQVHQVQEEN
jgi:hypothetical protein